MSAELEEYDFIVCGGGTSGCTVAARLAEEPNFKVLLLEAGRDSKDDPTIKMAGLWGKKFGAKDDWQIFSEPGPGLNGRRIQGLRGRFLGGSSNTNSTICIRGIKQDFDDWELDGWSGEEMFSYMAKAETFHNKDWFQPAMEEHGSDGQLHTSPHDLAPISKLIMESYQEAGLPFYPDMFTTGETANGCGHAMRTIHDGYRSVAADFVMDRTKWPNLEIAFNGTVDKILFESTGGATPRASTVEVVLEDGTRKSFKARKDIVISGGTYCSPPILLRSGIGPKAELEKLGIKVVQDLPGVGENLQDHLIVATGYEVNDTSLTRDRDIYPEGAFVKAMANYQKNRSGFLSTLPFGAFAFTRLDKRLAGEPFWNSLTGERDVMGLAKNQPNVEFYNTECYGGPPHFVDFPKDGQAAFFMKTLLMNAQSRGTVKLRNKDPLQLPVVDHKYLDHPLDKLVLAEGARFANEIVMKSKATKDIIAGSWPPHLMHHKMEDRHSWVEYVIDNAGTCYHPAGTCKMGTRQDPMAVVDERLRVYGVEGLRVVDVSIMPKLNQGHAQMPAYGIGEKAADMMKEDHQNVVGAPNTEELCRVENKIL